jgi:hypothetical protein
MSEPTACCRDCGASRDVPVEGVCPVCGSANVSLSDSDQGFGHELLALNQRDDQDEHPVACNGCGAELDEPPNLPADERQPCLRCGSLGRVFSVTLEAGIRLGGSLGLKMKSGGKGKPYLEQKHGDSYSTSRRKWVHLLQIVDRRNNRYRKLVTDPETGEVIRDVDEPLTDHQGYGADKPKN